MTTQAIQAIEIRFDETGGILKIAPWLFSRIHRPGDTFIDDWKEYRVIASELTVGKYGGALVEHVVRLVIDRKPAGTP